MGGFYSEHSSGCPPVIYINVIKLWGLFVGDGVLDVP